MTTETPVASGLDDQIDPPTRAGTARAAARRRAQRRRRIAMGAYTVAVALLAISIPVLASIGARTVLESSDGDVVDPDLDPDEPGYRALVPPSPTLLVFQTDAAGNLVGVVLLSLATEDGGGGGVLLIPNDTIANLPDIGPFPVEASFQLTGPGAAKATVEWALHIGTDEAVVVSAPEWTEILASTGPLTINNPDRLRTPDGVEFAAGQLVLQPEEVPVYAGFVGEGESRLNRVLRQELVWQAWLDRLAEDPSLATFPGEQSRGLARFIPGIVAGGHVLDTLPVLVETDPDDPQAVTGFAPDDEQFQSLLPRFVPFPAGGVAGDRPLVRILSGTEDRSSIVPAARLAVRGGAQVTAIGNADRTDHEETEILYFDPAVRPQAEAVAASLGFGTVTKIDEVDDSADITIILGADADL